jgi:hypothetical protein
MQYISSKNVDDLLGFDNVFKKFDEEIILNFVDQLQLQKSAILVGNEKFYLDQTRKNATRGKVDLNYLNEKSLVNHSELYHLNFDIRDFDFETVSLSFTPKNKLIIKKNILSILLFY